jgi:preprotein translocase subunit SecA
MRIFASDRMAGLMQKLGMEEGEAIEHPWVTRAIENAQRKVEGHNFDIRKQLLEFDDIANDQRKVVYEQRNQLMSTDDVSENVMSMRRTVLNDTISLYIQPDTIDDMWDIPGLETALREEYALDLPIAKWLDEDDSLHEETLRERILSESESAYQQKEDTVGAELMRHFEKTVMLQTLDSQWKEHLAQMDYLRAGISLRSYAQKDPKQEYKRESFSLFRSMLDSIKTEVIRILSVVQVRDPEDVEAVEAQRPDNEHVSYQHDESPEAGGEEAHSDVSNLEASQPFTREGAKVGRNDPCPCGSGKKFKQCHGKLT